MGGGGGGGSTMPNVCVMSIVNFYDVLFLCPFDLNANSMI